MTTVEYKRRVRAHIIGGTMTDDQWNELLTAIFEQAESLVGMPLMDDAVGAGGEDDD